MNILIILTSHSQLGHTQLGNAEGKTGFWIEEFATPYYIFQEAGAHIVLASPKGGQPPIDPKSDAEENQTPSTIRYKADEDLLDLMANTKKLSEVFEENFDAVFFPGGHGPMFDLATDKESINLIENFWNSKKPIATVCHSPAVLVNAKDKNGQYLVKVKNVTGFSNTEEEAVKLTHIVPFLLEDELKMKGAKYSKQEDWTAYSVTDGLLITGQNPQSSEKVALELLHLLKK